MRLLLLFAFLTSVSSLKILGIFPYAGKSHFVVFEVLLRELAKRGHQVTVVSEFPQKRSLQNYKDIALEQSPNVEIINIPDMPPPFLRKYAILKYLAQAAWETCDKLNQKSMQDLIKTTEKYDLLLIEYFNTDCFLGFAHKFKVPFIGLSSCYDMPWVGERVANPTNPAYIPNHFANFDVHMNFWERLENTILYLYTNIIYSTLMQGDEIAKKYFGDDLPPLHVLARNTSLFLVNTLPALNGARPKVPSFVEVGGMNINKPKQVSPTVYDMWEIKDVKLDAEDD
ncbi:UDP-glucosyltransferase [Holotrichia oblita]|uniref:UDP-glucosyltransferase n=3 Tax=Holotrichia oblita TaxID=644536 RepID=A0ACB9T847_HOLOL|nr:UDP-glucosyltransferase [Holotrichia oblita]KAI4462973.1 UDP-glucosyltransferase [Holotrichia oblita]